MVSALRPLLNDFVVHQRCTYRQVRTENIRTLLTIHPGGTLVDLYLLADMIRPCLSAADCQTALENHLGEERIDSYKTRMELDTNKLPGKLPTLGFHL
jgi:hypothetical protein